TVAELLARNGSSEGGGRRSRRHHRGEREGGISVAELTGEIPVIREPVAEDRQDRVSREAEEEQQSGSDAPAGQEPQADVAEETAVRAGRVSEEDPSASGTAVDGGEADATAAAGVSATEDASSASAAMVAGGGTPMVSDVVTSSEAPDTE